MAAVLIPKSTINQLRIKARKTIRKKYRRCDHDTTRMWQTKGSEVGDLACNCLPAHLAIIDEVKKRQLGKNPAVVIGDLLNFEEEISSEHKKALEAKSLSGDNPHSGYHAWIVLDVDDNQSDVIDITGHNYKEIYVSENYLNKSIAQRVGLKHHAVLTDERSVYSYHANLVKAQLQVGGEREKRLGLINYLRKFAKLQGVSEEIAFGHVGKKAQELELQLQQSATPETTVGWWSSIFASIRNAFSRDSSNSK